MNRSYLYSLLLHAIVLGAALAFTAPTRFPVSAGEMEISVVDAKPAAVAAQPRAAKARAIVVPAPSDVAVNAPEEVIVAPSSSAAVASTESAASSSSGGSVSEISAYSARIVALVNQAKRYPQEAIEREQEGRVTVHFVLLGDGTLESVDVATASTFESLNRAALQTVKRIGKFPAPPVASLASHFEVLVPIVFKIDR